jgi:hypothetical protein
MFKRFGERVCILIAGLEAQSITQSSYNLLQHFAIRLEFIAFYRALKLGIEIEDLSIVQILVVILQCWLKGTQDATLPVNQRAVTVEGQEFELVEVEGHGQYLLSRIAFKTQHSALSIQSRNSAGKSGKRLTTNDTKVG